MNLRLEDAVGMSFKALNEEIRRELEALSNRIAQCETVAELFWRNSPTDAESLPVLDEAIGLLEKKIPPEFAIRTDSAHGSDCT